jgi:hypothetical protein
MNAMFGTERWGGLSALYILLARQPGALPQAGMEAGLWPSRCGVYKIPLPPLSEQRRIVSELDAEAAQMEAVRGLLPRFEGKIQRVLDRVWGNGREVGPA